MLLSSEAATNWIGRALLKLTGAVTRRHAGPDVASIHSSNATGQSRETLEASRLRRRILPEVLSIDQFQARLDQGILIKSAIFATRVYLLKRGRKIQVWENRKLIGSLCVAPKASKLSLALDDPTTETYLSYYLNLTLNEREFMDVANFQRTASFFSEGPLQNFV